MGEGFMLSPRRGQMKAGSSPSKSGSRIILTNTKIKKESMYGFRYCVLNLKTIRKIEG